MIDLSTNLLPALSSEEEDRLRDSIRTHGFDPAYPVVVDEDGNVLDGWHRKRIAEELGIEPAIVVKTGLSHWEKVKLAVSRNVDRRQLDRWQTGRLAQKLLPQAEAEAAERKATGYQQRGARSVGQVARRSETTEHEDARLAAASGTDTQFNPPANDSTIARHREAGRAKDEVGSLLGVSRRTVDRAVRAIEQFEDEVVAAGVPEAKARPVIAALDQGHISIQKAKQALGLAPKYEGRSEPEVAAATGRRELMVQFINITRALSQGFNEEEARQLHELADDLFVPLRHIERLYCEERKK